MAHAMSEAPFELRGTPQAVKPVNPSDESVPTGAGLVPHHTVVGLAPVTRAAGTVLGDDGMITSVNGVVF